MDREAWKALWWIFIAPGLAYLLITHTWRISSAGQELLFVALATLSAAIFAITKA